MHACMHVYIYIYTFSVSAELSRPNACPRRIESCVRQPLRLRGSRYKHCSIAVPDCPSSLQTIVQAAHVSGYQHLRSKAESCGFEAYLFVYSFDVVVQWRQERQQLLELDQASSTHASWADLGTTRAPGHNGLISSTCSMRASGRYRHISSA